MTKKNPGEIKFAFFGTSHIAAYVLDDLATQGLVPARIITLPPRKKGRGLEAQPTDVELWGRERNIAVAYEWDEFKKSPPAGGWDVAVVVDYGKLLPNDLLAIPKRGFLNVHPSLLPKLRGASPIRSAIVNDERVTGVTIMQVGEGMDEGPIVAQKKIEVSPWPVGNTELERILVHAGGTLLAQILPEWVAGEIEAREQNHDIATYSEKIEKADGLLDLRAGGYKNLLKIKAFEGWPGTYAFFMRGDKSASRRIRVQIVDAHLHNDSLVIDSVKPEGKNEMRYEEFLRSGAHLL